MTVDWAARNTDRNNHIVYTSRNINYKDIAIADAGNIKSATQKARGSGQRFRRGVWMPTTAETSGLGAF
jgi:hypothetical protein